MRLAACLTQGCPPEQASPEKFARIVRELGPLPEAGLIQLANRLAAEKFSYEARAGQNFPGPNEQWEALRTFAKSARALSVLFERQIQFCGAMLRGPLARAAMRRNASPGAVAHRPRAIVLSEFPSRFVCHVVRDWVSAHSHIDPWRRFDVLNVLISDLAEISSQLERDNRSRLMKWTRPRKRRGGASRAGPTRKTELIHQLGGIYRDFCAQFPSGRPSLVKFVRAALEIIAPDQANEMQTSDASIYRAVSRLDTQTKAN
jgi:hypothetical protein